MIRHHSSSSTSSSAPDSRSINLQFTHQQQQQQPLPLGSNGKKFWAWRVSNLLAGCLFFMCAAVQINDPDPFVWIPIYTVPCLLAMAFSMKPTLIVTNAARWLMVAHAAICLAGLAYLIQSALLPVDNNGFHGNKRNPLAHEEGREAAGLVLVTAWLAAQLCLARFGSACSPAGMLALLAVLALLAFLPALMWSSCLIYDANDAGAPAHCADMARQQVKRPDL